MQKVEWKEIPAEEVTSGDHIRFLVKGEWHYRIVSQTHRRKTTVSVTFLGHPLPVEYSLNQRIKVEVS